MTNTVNLLQQMIFEQPIYTYNVNWRKTQDLWGRYVLELVSDVGDKLGLVWRSREGAWHSEKGQRFNSIDQATSNLETEICTNISDLALELSANIRRSNLNGICQAPRLLEANSFERFLIEKAILALIQRALSERGIQSTTKLNDSLNQQCRIKLHRVFLPYSYKQATCFLKPSSPQIKIEFAENEQCKIKVETLTLRDLSDHSFFTLIEEIDHKAGNTYSSQKFSAHSDAA